MKRIRHVMIVETFRTEKRLKSNAVDPYCLDDI
jgi:hypothetical protein